MANTVRYSNTLKKLQREEDKFNATFKKKTTKTDEEEKAPISEKSTASFLEPLGIAPKSAPQEAILTNPQAEAVAVPAIRNIPQIKDSIGSALEEKLGVLDAKSSIAKIEDSEVEKSIPIAEETVARNVKSGKISIASALNLAMGKIME